MNVADTSLRQHRDEVFATDASQYSHCARCVGSKGYEWHALERALVTLLHNSNPEAFYMLPTNIEQCPYVQFALSMYSGKNS
eukprot:5163677-Pleurochrysis_carterae.AAC.1